MKKVAVIFNGGTISMTVDLRIKAAGPTLNGEAIFYRNSLKKELIVTEKIEHMFENGRYKSRI